MDEIKKQIKTLLAGMTVAAAHTLLRNIRTELEEEALVTPSSDAKDQAFR